MTDDGLKTSLGQKYFVNTGGTIPPYHLPTRILGLPTNITMKPNERAEFLNTTTHEITHYDFFDFQIDDNYSSPSDVATNLTKQTHKLTNARINKGTNTGQVLTDSQGIPQNKFLIPVYTSAEDDNTEDTFFLNGKMVEGSYVLKKNIYNLPADRFTIDTNQIEFLPNGEYMIYFRTKHTTINKPTIADGSKDDIPVGNNEDFDVLNAFGGVPTARCEGADGVVNGYPIQFISGQNCFISQYIGANGITIGWDEAQSRFTIGYMGQPSVSTFDVASGSGGDYAISVFYPSPTGKDGYNFMNNMRRDGGINVSNWKSEFVERGLSPLTVRTLYNIPAKYTMDSYYDENINQLNTTIDANGYTRRLEWFNDVVVNSNITGNKFWNKLGFTDNQLNNLLVGHDIGAVDGNYTPKGTTELLLDSADAILMSDEPAENTPFYDTSGAFGKGSDTSAIEAKWEYGAIGGLQFNGHNVGYGVGSTSGRPVEFRRNAPFNVDSDKSTAFSEISSTYNPDRQEFNAYTLKTDTDILTAQTLQIFMLVMDMVVMKI